MTHAIELVDREFGHVRVPISRKIKFKGISFSNISKRWNEFRLNRLKSKLIADKEKLVSMEFSNAQLTKGRETTEQKIMRKTIAIAKLESKIQFLETGNYSTEEFINSRAIKLKKTMMSNLVYNRDSLYGLTDEAANEILNGSTVVKKEETSTTAVEEEMRKQQEMIAEEVQKIMAEEQGIQQEVQTDAEVIQNRPDVVPITPVEDSNELAGTFNPIVTEEQKTEIPIEMVNKNEVFDAINEAMATVGVEEPIQREEVAGTIDEAMAKIGVEEPIQREEVAGTIDEAMAKIEVEEPIQREEVAGTIDKAMEKIKVSGNESSIAKVNKFINDDGTYRMRREDIPEEFRITRIDRNEMHQNNELPENNELNIPPFGENVIRETPDFDIPRRAVTPIQEKTNYVIDPIKLARTSDEFAVQMQSDSDTTFIDGQTEQSAEISTEQHIEIPEDEQPREEYFADENGDTQEYTTEPMFSADIEAMMSEASRLKQDLVVINDQIAAAELASGEIDADYREAYEKFSGYIADLEIQRASLEKRKTDIESVNNDRRAQVDALIAMMENQPVVDSTPTKHK